MIVPTALASAIREMRWRSLISMAFMAVFPHGVSRFLWSGDMNNFTQRIFIDSKPKLSHHARNSFPLNENIRYGRTDAFKRTNKPFGGIARR